MKFVDKEDKIRYLKQIIFEKKSALPRNLKIVKHPKMSGAYFAVDNSTECAYIVFEDSQAVEDIALHVVPGYQHLK